MEAIAVAADTTAAPVALLPAGACLVHIGPHKTGTTSVQSAFHLARRELAAQGVHYAGPDRHPVIAVQAAIESQVGSGRRGGPIDRWRSLVAEIARHRAERVVISSEWFSDADDAAIRRIVGDLDPARVHVVLTVRSLDRLLPSQWQQHVAAGLTLAYEPWLDEVFGQPDSASATTFWRRHRHDRLAARWAEVVGAERVTVVVVDEVDRGAVLRAFERLVGLSDGALVPEPDRANRSFTAPEAELMLAVNAALGEATADPNLRLNLGLYGVAAAVRLREPGAEEARIETPAWALERAAEAATEIVAGLERSGARVLGDLGALTSAPGADPSRAAAPGPRATADAGDANVDWPGLIATAGIGALTATGLARVRRTARSPATVLAPLSTERLRRVVLQRAVNTVRVRLRPARHRTEPRDHASAASFVAPSAAPTAARDLTAAESTAVARFRDAVAAEGLPGTLYDRIEREGVMPELLRLGDRAANADAARWPAIGAALALGVIRASGLIPGGPQGNRLPPPRARIETLEVAGLPTVEIAIVIIRRVIAAVPRRIAAAISRNQPARSSPGRGAP